MPDCEVWPQCLSKSYVLNTEEWQNQSFSFLAGKMQPKIANCRTCHSVVVIQTEQMVETSQIAIFVG